MARKLIVEIVGDARSLDKAFKKSSKNAKNFEGDMSKTGRAGKKAFGGLGRGVGLLTGAIGVAGLAGAAKAAFGEFSEAQKVTAQTGAVLKSTGKAANVSAKQVEDLAGALSDMSGVDDEAIQSGENMLLTFTRIRNEVGKGNDIFDQATKATLDLSVAMGKDMKSSAILVGKALNDPTKRVGALSRAGVQFTVGQKRMIKNLVASGKTMQAQKIILNELRTQFEGSAKAAGSTLSGQLNKLRDTVLNLSAELVEKLMPAITRLVERAVKWLNNSKNQKAIIDALTTAGKALGTVLNTLKTAFETLSRIVGGNRNAIIALVAAYATFKALQMAATLTRMAGTFGLLTTATRTNTAATRTATVANRAFALSMVGKAGLVAGVGIAAFAITSYILKLTGLDKKLKQVGASAFDLAAKLGAVKDPMAEFAGKKNLTPAMVKSLRREASGIKASPQQTANILGRRHPNLAQRDIEVAVGARRPGAANVTVNQYFRAPTPDRHREARRARQAARAAFDS